jgi:Pyruvate/2-oxoacid:ferredoxin oxidoreductase delta subunit
MAKPEDALTNRTTGRRVIEVKRGLVAPAPPRARSLHAKSAGDFPGVPQVYLQVAKKLSSPLLMGPPLCEELIAFLRHLFTEEEAGVVRHLGQFTGRNAEQLAWAERRPLEQVVPILQRLAVQKRAIASSGPEHKLTYRLLPIMPGIFEMVLIGQSPETMSPWHRRFAELFEALYETGYALDYQHGQQRPTPFVRVLPVGRAIEAHPLALPSDQLEVVLDRYHVFGVGQCQCRMVMEVKGQGCGKPIGNCTVMGQWAERGIARGWLRQVSRKDVLEIKREAESHGLVTWIMNVESLQGQVSCSCCGCCCHAMRMVNEFNAPGVMAPAHFQPRFDDAHCTHCGRCAQQCPMGALAVDCRQKTREHRVERCIGCGLCLVACGDRRAIVMQPVPKYQLPYQSWFSLLFHSAPGMLQGAWKAWRAR